MSSHTTIAAAHKEITSELKWWCPKCDCLRLPEMITIKKTGVAADTEYHLICSVCQGFVENPRLAPHHKHIEFLENQIKSQPNWWCPRCKCYYPNEMIRIKISESVTDWDDFTTYHLICSKCESFVYDSP